MCVGNFFNLSDKYKYMKNRKKHGHGNHGDAHS